MANDAQIQALLRKIEADELELVTQRRAIEAVADKRQAELQSVQDRWNGKKQRVAELRGKSRGKATREKKLDEVVTGIAFVSRLEQELKAMLPELEEKRADAERASQRLTLIEAEFRSKQLEKRQLEKLLENRYHAGRVVEEAREEAVQDEMSRPREKSRSRE